MQGRRRSDGTSPFDLEPGDYSKRSVTNHDETDHWTMWYVCAPDGQRFYLANEHDRDRSGKHHEVDEHDDGTISVVPKPANSNSIQSPNQGWHGWIDHGVWKEHL